MPRPCKCRRIYRNPQTTYFKPCGVSIAQLEEIVLTVDEFEAVRLADLQGLYQEDAAKKMNISRQTFGNIIQSAHGKIAEVIVNAKALKIDGGVVKMMQKQFLCSDCNHQWNQDYGSGRPAQCPKCQSANIHRAPLDRGWARAGRGGRGRGICGRMGI